MLYTFRKMAGYSIVIVAVLWFTQEDTRDKAMDASRQIAGQEQEELFALVWQMAADMKRLSDTVIPLALAYSERLPAEDFVLFYKQCKAVGAASGNGDVASMRACMQQAQRVCFSQREVCQLNCRNAYGAGNARVFRCYDDCEPTFAECIR
jgi:hypothetical protein